MSQPNRSILRNTVLTALERLRTTFPLEARLSAADAVSRQAYVEVLRHWLRGTPPPMDLISPTTRTTLTRLDAIVPVGAGIGCYPFSARDTGIRVRMADHVVFAMCALDALAIARLAGMSTQIDSNCEQCATPVRLRVEDDGSLDHDQADRVNVAWLSGYARTSTCSEGLCRSLRFLCPTCQPPAGSDSFTLPQAATLANAFFGFQRKLLQSAVESPE